MTSNISRFKADIAKLVAIGNSMLAELTYSHLASTNKLTKEQKVEADELRGIFDREYQRWYTEGHAVIKQLIPDRLSEFEHLYKGDGKRRAIQANSYTIQDWLTGMRAVYDSITGEKPFDDLSATAMRFRTQLNILEASSKRFESSLFDIRQLVQADLFDSELDAARELAKHGFIRGAGAIAGVVLEKHLGQVARNHNISVRKQHPTISDLNDALKNGDVIDTPTWRGIQRLGDLRNLCDHNKNRDPKPDEIDELVEGTEKYLKTLF